MNPVSLEASKKKSLVNSGIIMCVLGIAFYYYEYYLRVAPSILRLELKEMFNLTDASFGNLAACYFYAYTPLQLPVGLLIDRYGVRTILTFACLICASSICILASGTSFMLAKMSWFLLGFGSAFAYVGVLKIADAELPQKYFSFVAGICSAFGMFGGISGELIMSHFISVFDWQTALHYSGIMGFILAILLWSFLRNRPQEEFTYSHMKTTPLSGLKDILKSKEMWINGIIGCLTFLPVSIFAGIWAVPYLEAVGFDRSDSIVGSSLIFLGYAIGGPLWGFISTKVESHRKLLIMGSFIAALLMAIVIWSPSTTPFIMYSLLFLSALFASTQIMVFSISNNLCRSSISATAASFTNMVVMVGGVFLPQIVGLLLDNSLSGNDLIQYSYRDFSQALSLLPVGLTLAGFLSLYLKETYRKH
jgi:MFS family permease